MYPHERAITGSFKVFRANPCTQQILATSLQFNRRIQAGIMSSLGTYKQ